MNCCKKDRLLHIFKFIVRIFDICSQSKEMADFLSLQGKLERSTSSKNQYYSAHRNVAGSVFFQTSFPDWDAVFSSFRDKNDHPKLSSGPSLR